MKYGRTDAILKYIVEYFIKHAQAIGSQTLIDEYHLPYSSATIRNEMYTLEQMGLIEKTHTSSGRIPSTKGYQYYCEHLRDRNVNDELKYSLQTVLNEKVQSIEEVIKASCEILSHMTSLVSVVVGPDDEREKLASAQLVQISDNTITAIFVTDHGYVENKTFIIKETINANEVVQCVKILNDRLKGTAICDLPEKMEALQPILKDYVVSHDAMYQALMELFVRFASDRLSLYGRDELFNNPEFRNDTKKLEQVFKLLNDTSVFKDIGSNLDSKENKTVVNIGGVKGNEDVSMVTTKIKIGKENESSITLLGPRRMDYDKALSALEYIAEELSRYFENDDGGGGNENGEA
jgi:heat-inducible transcriptional repressor